MADRQTKKTQHRRKKALRVRRRLRGDAARPRLSVHRSITNIYCQVIDDASGRTIVAASTNDKSLRTELGGLKKTEAAAKVGQLIASRAKEAGITAVRFDRGPYMYHGRVRALAEAARQGGLQF